ncbi:hypothetical protein [Halomonas sp. E14]|uniref:hypothetical protein n=1 Tax=Halomonas sp. E14 TaxID=3397245 RepID=UPI00403EAED0
MLRWLTGKHPIPVWVIKQIDRDLLHLCGQGSVLPETRRSDVVASLHEDRYQGAVTLGGSGPVLNARLFAALVPVESLALETHGEAMWRGSRWLVSQVPQRCWAYEGRLVAKPPPPGISAPLVSVEDVSEIRRQAQVADARGNIAFALHDDGEPSLLAPREPTASPTRPFPAKHGDWRNHD